MTNKVFFVLAAVLLSSCSNDWSAGLADKRTSSLAAPSTEHVDVAGGVRAARSFADAPDRGSLVQYPQNPVVRRSGAYTWHAADLSEEHALRSTITGNLSFTAPDGTPINLAYERHVEHPDGNWSWIGRAEGERGESTVITFGEEAVFGTIPQARGRLPLRLTISGGRTWVVSADPRLLREIRNEATHPKDQDFLVPPKLAASTATAPGGMEAMGAEAVATTTASGKTMVDVLVGFTDGYSTYRGGASAAITRIHNLVEVTNQAYRNSQVKAEVRLVHSMQISYPDATANKTALQELTGFKAPSTRTTPAPAFSALRSARDQYGADLVVLLRRFRDPENEGCGIAWLIGGGQSGIDTSDEFFGYSVVSDGQDTGTDGKTYFCREETFAHELGHNMGSQHDGDNAKKDDGTPSHGLYSYSFGYKTTAAAGDFYTVMAYGDQGQTRNRVFSNPNVSICGIDANLVCGVVDQTDNARSLGQAMPLVANFRATLVPQAPERSRNDINGDGRSDIVWHGDSWGKLVYWRMNGSTREGYTSKSLPSGYRVVATGDFNGDGRGDLLWENIAQTGVWMWLAKSTGDFTAVYLTDYPSGYRLAGAEDINGDGRSDILWHNDALGKLVYWRMNGAVVEGYASKSLSKGYKVVGTGDFNGDGRGDLLWENNARTGVWMWLAKSTGDFTAVYLTDYPAAYRLAGVEDINADGRSDILWHSDSLGKLVYWRMNGSVREGYTATNQSSGYRVVTTGDFNGDGRGDLLWENSAKTGVWMWLAKSTGDFTVVYLTDYPSGYRLVPWAAP